MLHSTTAPVAPIDGRSMPLMESRPPPALPTRMRSARVASSITTTPGCCIPARDAGLGRRRPRRSPGRTSARRRSACRGARPGDDRSEAPARHRGSASPASATDRSQLPSRQRERALEGAVRRGHERSGSGAGPARWPPQSVWPARLMMREGRVPAGATGTAAVTSSRAPRRRRACARTLRTGASLLVRLGDGRSDRRGRGLAVADDRDRAAHRRAVASGERIVGDQGDDVAPGTRLTRTLKAPSASAVGARVLAQPVGRDAAFGSVSPRIGVLRPVVARPCRRPDR